LLRLDADADAVCDRALAPADRAPRRVDENAGMKPTLAAIAALATAAATGCVVLSNVTPIGDGAFMTVVRSNDVNAPVEQDRAKAMSDATAFCDARGATVEVVRLDAPTPTPGQAPSAELDFRCRPRA
jgi:hypothetical protein